MKYTSAKYIRETLNENSFSPLKKFGQNFLIDENIVNKICEVAGIKDQNVVEIGPGLGALTSYMLKSAKKLVAVEIDNGFYRYLTDEFKNEKTLKIINNDILQVDIEKLIYGEFGSEEIILAANLPYYITTACIMKFLTANINISRLVVMVQKEVANRLCAKPGDKGYGSISAIISHFGKATQEISVSKNCFYPMPDIDSTVIKIEVENKPSDATSKFIDFVRVCFAMKRKTLFNNLKKAGYDKEKIISALQSLSLDEKIRAERLSENDFARLIKALT